MTKLKEDFEASGGEFEEWRIDRFFHVKTPIKKFNANAVVFGSKHPYVVRTSQNNGVRAYLDENEKYLNEANTISFGQDTATMFYQEKPYFTGDKIKVMKFKYGDLTSLVACYLLASMGRSFSLFSWGASSFNEKVLNSVLVKVPTKASSLAYDYMEQYISLLEEEIMLQVDKFLKDSGLNDTTLTAEETAALEKFRKGDVKFKEWKIGELFEKIKVNSLKYKVKNLEGKHDEEFNLPALTAGIENQGLSCFVPRTNATILKNVISVSANGANTGVMFYQPNEFTVLQDSYAIKHINNENTSKNEYMFFVSVLQKTIRGNYTWSEKAGWERIKTESISVPVTIDDSNAINYDFMHHFISAQEKLAIKGVVKYKDKKIEAAKEIVISPAVTIR